MSSGSRFRVAPQSFTHLVHQRIAREGLLKEETVLQEVFVPLLITRGSLTCNDPNPVGLWDSRHRQDRSPVVDTANSREPSSLPKLSTPRRSEEHTSELQSQSNLVCRLLLEQ